MRRGFVLLIVTVILMSVATFFLVRYAQGYRLSLGKNLSKNGIQLTPTGLLVATSTPDGASVYIDDHLTSATDTTIDLPPGEYTVKIVKEEYLPWEKKLKIQKEVVTQTEALLFPVAPRLESLTKTGVLNPAADPGRSMLAFGVASASASMKNGVYVLDMTASPILALRNSSVQIANDTSYPLSRGTFEWSPNGRELLVRDERTKATYRLRTSEFNNNASDVTATVPVIKAQWEQDAKEIEEAKLETLRPGLQEFIRDNFKIIAWSADETKILYEASSSGEKDEKRTIPLFIEPPLIGTNGQPETREIKPGQYYVYDIKEDKNFYLKDIDPNLLHPLWFSDSRHFVFIEERQIKVMEYDGTNKTVVYSGPFEGNFVYPWPDGSRLVITTSLNPQGGVAANLYTINLK